MELEQELAQRTERQIQLETTVREETERASTLRDELASLKIEFSRRADTRQDRIAQREAALQTQQGRIAELESLLEASERALGERQAELDTQAEALAEARAEREALERRLAESAEKPLSEELVDPELPVEEQSRRITTLQRELTERIDALRELQDGELQDGRRPGAVVDFGARRSEDRPATAAERFTLVCLTSDEPASYDIVKPDMTIGRSSSCDIQILTHFVSREHARLELDEDRVTLEDLGSTNGVFVNAVRVDRQILQHGDWVTIGETQFRFLDAQDS